MNKNKTKNYKLVRLAADARTLSELEQIEICCFGGERWDKKMLSDTVNSGVCHAFGVREVIGGIGGCIGDAGGMDGADGANVAGGRLVASMIFSAAEDISELLTLAVVPDARKQGISEELLAFWQDECGRRGATKLYLEVNTENAAAIALYKKHGFANVGRRNNYYTKSEYNSNDAYVFAKVIE